jgi:hypothetical protein
MNETHVIGHPNSTVRHVSQNICVPVYVTQDVVAAAAANGDYHDHECHEDARPHAGQFVIVVGPTHGFSRGGQ